MRHAAIAVIVLALLVTTATGAHQARDAITRIREFEKARPETTAWEDDIESGENGWTHGDMTATAVPHFHTDTYMAYQGGTSWWCGNFDYDEDGGYGNNWDDRLDVPATDWTGYTYPVLRFQERHDSEPDYDFTYVQAESSGIWINMNRGFNGTTTWDRKEYYLGWYDNPAVIRFRFVSDGAWSDEDGDNSVGGGFICDNIEIIDYVTTDVLFWDDVESGGLCTPSVPGAAGDYWRIVESACQAYSDPHVWVVASPDTDLVQPNVQNWLQTPLVDISALEPVDACTLWTTFQFWIPAASGGGWTEQVTTDGGETWNTAGAWYGDQCGYGYGPCDHFLFFIDLTPWLPATGDVAVRWIVSSDDDGISADPLCSYESTGMTIDDTWFQVYYTELAAAQFAATQQDLVLNGSVGGTIVETFEVENTGNVNIESGLVTFAMSDLEGPGAGTIPGASGVVDPASAAMPLAGGPVEFELTIDVPAGLDAGDYEGTLKLYVDEVLADELDITVTLALGGDPVVYPNPYRTDTHDGDITITFGAAEGDVSVKIYDMFTALVRDLTDDVAEGAGEVMWDLENDDGKEVASGMYLVTIDDGDEVKTQRIMIIK
jgi:hypothetical protein